jgi:serine/threonine-protein kinase
MGGMATVHRAKKRGPENFERAVALKRMLAHLAEDPTFVESFVREAKVASLLQHPNIAQIYDFGRIGGIYYIAMELVQGYDLRKLLRFANRSNTPIPLAVVLTILSEMCEALEYAHGFIDETGTPLRIVHRDISPSNLIVASTGHLKVIDFGIAKAHSRSLHTESGSVKGKLGYMSPEAAIGMQVASVSDIFSMGVVAWELITASPLFSARSDFETIRRVREAQILPPSTRNPGCPPELDAVVLSALSREPETRMPSATAFREAIEQIAQNHRIQINARQVAEWMNRIAAFDGPAQRAKNPSQPPPPSPTSEAPTSYQRLRAPSQPPLRRSEEDMRLAAEVWGSDDAQAPTSGLPAGDFSMNPPGYPSGNSLPGLVGPNNVVAFNQDSGGHSVPSLAQLPQARPSQVPARASGYPSQPPPYSSTASAAGYPSQPPAYGSVQPHPSAPQYAPSHGTGPRQSPSMQSGPMASMQSGPLPSMSGHLSNPSMSYMAPPRKKKGSKLPLLVLAILVPIAAGLAVVLLLQRNAPEVAVNRGAVGSDPSLDTASTAPPPVTTAPGAATPTAGSAASPNPTATTTPIANDVTTPPPPVTPPPTTPKLTKTKKVHVRNGVPAKDDDEETSAKVEEPKVEEPKVEPKIEKTEPKVEPKKVEPKTEVKPPKPVDTRTAVVAASAVTKVSGELPAMRVAASDASVTAKLCIDETGKVSSAKLVKAPEEVADDLTRALSSWRYKPYVNHDNKPSAACFIVSLRLVVK